MTSSTGTRGLTCDGLPPRRASASRMAARSTTAGTPVKSCMSTRSGVKRDLVRGVARGLPVALGVVAPDGDGDDVVRGDVRSVLVAQQVLEQHLDGVGQPRRVVALGERGGVQAEDFVGAATDGEVGPALKLSGCAANGESGLIDPFCRGSGQGGERAPGRGSRWSRVQQRAAGRRARLPGVNDGERGRTSGGEGSGSRACGGGGRADDAAARTRGRTGRLGGRCGSIPCPPAVPTPTTTRGATRLQRRGHDRLRQRRRPTSRHAGPAELTRVRRRRDAGRRRLPAGQRGRWRVRLRRRPFRRLGGQPGPQRADRGDVDDQGRRAGTGSVPWTGACSASGTPGSTDPCPASSSPGSR